MLQPLIATLIVLFAAYWLIRRVMAVLRAAKDDASIMRCGSCSGCSHKKSPHVISLDGPPLRSSARI